MHRTQIYLDEEEREALTALARRTGRPVTEIIREAIGFYLSRDKGSDLANALRETHGLWRDHPSADLRQLRSEWETRSQRWS